MVIIPSQLRDWFHLDTPPSIPHGPMGNVNVWRTLTAMLKEIDLKREEKTLLFA